MTLHESFGEVLRAFELGGALRRTEYFEPCRLKGVHDACRERRLGTDDRQGDLFGLREFNQLGVI